MTDIIDLNGEWQLRWSDGQRGRKALSQRDSGDDSIYLSAQVPGEVHLDLIRAGLLAEPNEGLACLSARWVEESIWTYRREFSVTPEVTQGRSWLSFEGLDLTATIVLNDTEIGKHKNSFLPYRVEVTGKLREGKNVLAVHVESGLFDVADRRVAGFLNSDDQLLHKRHWLRKPQSSFSWDWSPRLLNVGVTGSVALEYTIQPARIDMLTPLVTVSDDLRTGSVTARLFLEGTWPDESRGTLRVEIEETGESVEAEVAVKPGLGSVEAVLVVKGPKLWWPVGHGDPDLYTLNVSLTIDGISIGTRSARIGFRRVVVNQEKHPESGRYFTLEINGKKIFAKGANFVPADVIPARLDRARYDKLTDLALEANFNLLRVWGGGLYESRDFYELCDRKGLMVWQEFIYACGRFPMQDAEFYENVKQEATYQVRRLARYPSLVVWCGNNEMEWGSWEWGYDRTGEIMPDYAFFHLTLPRILAAEDPTRYYQPSSPYSPDLETPNADHTGDQHPWNVGIFGHDFRDYRKMICRFPNEGGTLGPTSLPTMLACLPEGQRRYNSFAWQVHDNSIAGLDDPGVMEKMFDLFLGLHPRDMDITAFTYWAGLLQGESLSEYIGNFRRRMFDSSAAIFWMYNDVWPATRSWTIVDYYLNRTPSFSPVRRSCAPLSIVVADEDETIGIYGVNETGTAVTGSLRYGVLSLAGDYPIDRTADVTLAPNASTRIASVTRDEWLAIDALRTHTVAFAQLTGSGGSLLGRGRLFVPTFREMTWPKANVRVKLSGGRAVFESDTFAWGVCIDLGGEHPLGDNFFDIYPGIPYVVEGAWKKPPTVLKVGNLA